MGHYESTQLRTGFWGSASLRDSLVLLPPWASSSLLTSDPSGGTGNAVQTAIRDCARPSPVSLVRQSLSFDGQLLHAPSWDITSAEESHFNNSVPFRARREDQRHSTYPSGLNSKKELHL